VIASVRGRVAAVSPDHAVIEVGGVGLAVQCAPATLASLRTGEPARLATSLVVREDSLTLYGFADDDAKQLFELLQTASGVGPRLAQAVLAVYSPDAVRTAIATGDTATLTRVPGIGKKGAERLVLELRDRIGPVGGTDAGPGAGRTGLDGRAGGRSRGGGRRHGRRLAAAGAGPAPQRHPAAGPHAVRPHTIRPYAVRRRRPVAMRPTG
jgi:holliday junction DNA helicase RuvA